MREMGGTPARSRRNTVSNTFGPDRSQSWRGASAPMMPAGLPSITPAPRSSLPARAGAAARRPMSIARRRCGKMWIAGTASRTGRLPTGQTLLSHSAIQPGCRYPCSCIRVEVCIAIGCWRWRWVWRNGRSTPSGYESFALLTVYALTPRVRLTLRRCYALRGRTIANTIPRVWSDADH